MTDLAARISDGAIAVLELVPGEQRFADLSRFVLKGGASRFAPVVLEDEPVRYVLPVGVPGRKLDFGTLLVQKSRCALVWRTEVGRPYHAMITDLGPDTTVSQSPVTVRGEVWGRFDLRHPGTANMTFLVPPVASPELPKLLRRVLVEEPRSKAERIATEPLPSSITQAPAPAPTPAPQPSAPVSTPDSELPTRRVADPEATTVMDAVADPQSTAVLADAPETRQPAPVIEDADLYRSSVRTTPETAPLPAVTDETPVKPSRWTARSTDARASETLTTADSRAEALPAEMDAEPVEVERRSGVAEWLPYFLYGFLPALIIGGLFVLAKWFGWLG